MKTFDSRVRVVSVDTLRVLCARASSMCHRFSIASVSRSRVTIEYSNPDEYGHDHPVSFVLPCYPSGFGLVLVVLDCMRVVGARDEHDSDVLWQALDSAVLSHPTVWPTVGSQEPRGFMTHAEIRAAGLDRGHDAAGSCRVCSVCDLA